MDGFVYVSASLLAVWALLFVASEHTRRGQLVMSLVGALLSPRAMALVSADYRRADEAAAAGLGAPEVAFAFALFGVAAVVAHHVLSARTASWRGARLRYAKAWAGAFANVSLSLGLWLFASVALALVFGLGAFPALMCGGLLIGGYLVADRHDQLLDALVSGAVMATLVFLVEQAFFLRLFPGAAEGFWRIDNLSGILLAGIPVEEILWAAVVGFTVGPLYEFARTPRS